MYAPAVVSTSGRRPRGAGDYRELGQLRARSRPGKGLYGARFPPEAGRARRAPQIILRFSTLLCSNFTSFTPLLFFTESVPTLVNVIFPRFTSS